MKNLSEQPIYKFFVVPLNEIRSNIERGNIGNGFVVIWELNQKIAITDYEPFKAYQAIVAQLELRTQLGNLLIQCSQLLQGNVEDAIKQSVMGQLDALKAYAHFLNFLECVYISPERTRQQNKALCLNAAPQLGLVFKETRQQTDCRGNVQLSILPAQNELTIQPSDYELIAYNKIIFVYEWFIAMQTAEQTINERARQFAHFLFNHTEEISIDSPHIAFLKTTIKAVQSGNMFFDQDIPAAINTVVTLRNQYQEELKKKLSSPEECGVPLKEMFRP